MSNLIFDMGTSKKLYAILLTLWLTAFSLTAHSQSVPRTITVQTNADATVWIDGIKRGVSDENGRLVIRPVAAGIRKLRVRAYGFKEVSKIIPASQAGILRVNLVKTISRSELAFQDAERTLAEDKEAAIELYRKAIRIRPGFAQAYVALARALTGVDNKAAHAAIAKARRYRPLYAEASTVEGRIFRSEGDLDKAIDAFDRAVREGKGFQPEAHTGLGLIFMNEAEGAGAEGDLEDEKYYYEEAAKSLGKAVDQFSATETIVYRLLGEVYEKMGEKEKAIAVYERFLRDFPESNERSVVESFIVQIRREMTPGQ